MSVYLRTNFQVSSIILRSFRQVGMGVILLPPLQNESLESPPRLMSRIFQLEVISLVFDQL